MRLMYLYIFYRLMYLYNLKKKKKPSRVDSERNVTQRGRLFFNAISSALRIFFFFALVRFAVKSVCAVEDLQCLLFALFVPNILHLPWQPRILPLPLPPASLPSTNLKRKTNSSSSITVRMYGARTCECSKLGHKECELLSAMYLHVMSILSAEWFLTALCLSLPLSLSLSLSLPPLSMRSTSRPRVYILLN